MLLSACCQVHHPPQGDADEDALWEPVLRRVPFPPANASRGTMHTRLVRLGRGGVAFALRTPPIYSLLWAPSLT